MQIQFFKLQVFTSQLQQKLTKMENDVPDDENQRQIACLKFMQVTECESYDQAKQYVTKNNFILKDALDDYIGYKGQSISKPQQKTQSSQRNQSAIRPQLTSNSGNLVQFSMTPEQAMIFEQRLRSSSSFRSRMSSEVTSQLLVSQRTGIFSKICNSCKGSFKCFKKVRKSLQKKVNSMRKNDSRIFYFQQIYEQQIHQAGISVEDELIQSFELSNVEQNHKIKVMSNKKIRPIFALVASNRKSSLISNFIRSEETMNFIRQNFEVVFLTLSQLKQISLNRKHSLKNISKCPTALVYMKNFYHLEDVLVRFQGENLKNINLHSLSNCLTQLPALLRKWNQLLNLQKQLRENSITSLNQVVHYENDEYQNPYYDVEQSSDFASNFVKEHDLQTKKSLIQQQTKIYEEMVAEERVRKERIQLQKQKLNQVKQLREIRKISLPEQPSQKLVDKIIQFRFRCPLNGQYISRRFLKEQKVDILYQYVDINQKIQFQIQSQRHFDLFTSFPPTSLSDRKQQYLRDVFDQQKQNILIREI